MIFLAFASALFSLITNVIAWRKKRLRKNLYFISSVVSLWVAASYFLAWTGWVNIDVLIDSLVLRIGIILAMLSLGFNALVDT